LSALALFSQEDIVQRPDLTEYLRHHQQEHDAPSRHDIALARYLETQQAHRASAACRHDPVAVVALALAAFVGRVFRAALRRNIRRPTNVIRRWTASS
jgi:hypothetical protein